MEVKDINNQNTSLAILKKNGGSIVASDFSALIAGKKEDFGAASVGLNVETSEKAVVAKPDASARTKKTSSDVAEIKPRKESRRKERSATEEYTAPVVIEKSSAPEMEKEPMTVANATPTSDNGDSASVDDSMASVAERETVLSSPAAPQQNAEALVEPKDVEVLGDVMYFDAKTGSFVRTTGAELAAALKNGEVSGLTMADLSDFAGKPLLAQTVTTSDSVASEGIDISAMTSVSAEETIGFSTMVIEDDVRQVVEGDRASDVSKTAIADDVSNAKSEAIAEDVVENEPEVVVEGKKIKLDVKVNGEEEKISYHSRQEMLADAVALNATADADVSSKPAVEQSAPHAATLSAANSSATASLPGDIVGQAAIQNFSGDTLSSATAASSTADTMAVSMAPASAGTARQAQILSGGEVKSPAEDALKGMSREVVEQVKVNITKSAVKGVDKIDVSLKPEDLGHIEIKMQISKDGKLQAHIIASRPETMEILQKDMQILQKAFADAGFQTDENSLSFSFQDNGQAWRQQEEESGLRQFMGKMFENEGENDNLPLSETVWDGKSALNIRV